MLVWIARTSAAAGSSTTTPCELSLRRRGSWRSAGVPGLEEPALAGQEVAAQADLHVDHEPLLVERRGDPVVGLARVVGGVALGADRGNMK